jgi:hypothetical protein
VTLNLGRFEPNGPELRVATFVVRIVSMVASCQRVDDARLSTDYQQTRSAELCLLAVNKEPQIPEHYQAAGTGVQLLQKVHVLIGLELTRAGWPADSPCRTRSRFCLACCCVQVSVSERRTDSYADSSSLRAAYHTKEVAANSSVLSCSAKTFLADAQICSGCQLSIPSRSSARRTCRKCT